MKLLQRQEMKEATEFFNKITAEREAQDKKLETEQQVINGGLQTYKICLCVTLGP